MKNEEFEKLLKQEWSKLPLETRADKNKCCEWYFQLTSNNSPLLKFRVKGDKWQTVQGWINRWQSLDVEIRGLKALK